MLKLAKRTESQRPILGWVPFVGFNGVSVFSNTYARICLTTNILLTYLFKETCLTIQVL